MKKIILISQPEPGVLKRLASEFFTDQLKGKLFGYLPCEGNSPDNDKYTPLWRDKVVEKGGEFRFIDNSKPYEDSGTERKLVESSDYLMVPGGNTFRLLNNLRKSGIFGSIRKFFQKEECYYLGMSAGAIILAPTIQFSTRSEFSFGADASNVGLKDLSGLGVINFEPAVHFNPEEDTEALEAYKKRSKYEVKPISNDEVVILTL